KEESFEIIGACMNVHKELGFGFFEEVYQQALEHEFKLNYIHYEREIHLRIKYRDIYLDKQYIADFICYDKIIVELKAVSSLTGEHYAQVINYLKATGYKLGLLVNFGTKSLEYKRLVLS
ncbi:MAG: GxxExxY protein, partial [Lentisphaerota bacterium]